MNAPIDYALLTDEQQRLAAFWNRTKCLKNFIETPGVEEIVVNRPNEVWLWVSGGWERHDVDELSYERLISIGKDLAELARKPFDEEFPILSTVMPGGARVEITRPPASIDGEVYINIRLHSTITKSHKELIEQGYYKQVKHHYSSALVEDKRAKLHEYLSDDEKTLWKLASENRFDEFMELAPRFKQNIIVSGSTGSGKTSYCRALIDLIPEGERIVMAEDTLENTLPKHPNRNNLIYKKKGQGKGATAKEQLESAMRKRPSRVMIGELRGDECMFYLSGVLSSGHPGGIATTHANSPKDAFFRLSYLVMSSEEGRNLDLEVVRRLLYMTVHVVVQIEYLEKVGRCVTGIYYDPMYRMSLFE